MSVYTHAIKEKNHRPERNLGKISFSMEMIEFLLQEVYNEPTLTVDRMGVNVEYNQFVVIIETKEPCGLTNKIPEGAAPAEVSSEYLDTGLVRRAIALGKFLKPTTWTKSE
jgi:hypothetical protein